MSSLSFRFETATNGFSFFTFVANTFFKNEVNIYCLTFVGDVAVSENLPNEAIDTGHSCQITAEAQNIIARLIKSNYTRCPMKHNSW